MSGSDPDIGIGTLLKLVILPIFVVGFIGLILAMQTVPAGHVGVEKGYAGDTTGNELQPGTHFIAPWHSVQLVECRPRTYSMVNSFGEGEKAQREDAVNVQSINGTNHDVDVTIRYSIDCSDGAPTEFVDRWGSEEQMEQRLIRPDSRSDIRDEGASISSLTIYKTEGRERLANTAESTITTNFEDEPVNLQAVKIREVTIPNDLAAELEQKEQAKVRIETKQNEIQVERKEAERKRIEAQADAEVIEIKGEALRENEIVLKQEYIDALRNGNAIYVVPDNGGTPVLLEASNSGNATATSGLSSPGDD